MLIKDDLSFFALSPSQTASGKINAVKQMHYIAWIGLLLGPNPNTSGKMFIKESQLKVGGRLSSAFSGLV